MKAISYYTLLEDKSRLPKGWGKDALASNLATIFLMREKL
jgi:hypothetical protein